MKLKSVLIGLIAVVFFSVLYAVGIFDHLNNQVYNSFLHFRIDRERISNVVFLDADDEAIEYNGVFPWPRSVIADSLLRLKEFGVKAAVFDIEYMDKGPQGVDTIYLNQGLYADFRRSFSEISSIAGDLLPVFWSGNIDREFFDELTQEFFGIVNSEEQELYKRVQGIARDNDEYLIQASALLGNSWATLNLRKEMHEGEDQVERREIAEKRFSYPIAAAPNTYTGDNIDIRPTIPGFARAAKGSGFTNVVVDPDGIRRRIPLAQNINGHWYLQLAFAPLVDYLGNPVLELNNNKMLIKDAKMPDGITKDIVIPLDGQARMLLDWPKEDYVNSYAHISFVLFSQLEELEAQMEMYARALVDTNISFFAQFDPSLSVLRDMSWEMADVLDAKREAKNLALEYTSDEYFDDYLYYSSQSRDLIREFSYVNVEDRINEITLYAIELFPEYAELIISDAEYIIDLLVKGLPHYLDEYERLQNFIEEKVRDKFCILGRVDTGTTDIGSNPFWPEYVNVGTHGVVLDTILSESFITPVANLWLILFSFVFVVLFFLVSTGFTPVPRAVTGFLITVLVVVGCVLLFRYAGIYFGPILITVSMIGAVIAREIISYAGSEREKQFIRRAFSTYVSNDVVKELIADPSRLQLGGTKRHMSAIFTDVQGFSTISEKLDPEKLVSLLNHYLTSMSDVVLDEKGTIDKYEGDAIIAFFGAPVEMPDHAFRACVSSLTMKRIEQELNQKIREENLSPSPLLTRIGINTGSMVAGNMGTGNKMNYTIMGNAVNIAARLEGVNKQYKTWILAPDDTIRETEGRILTRRLDKVRVVGVNEPIQLHELINVMADATAEEKKLVEVFHQALDHYIKRDWKIAAQGFTESLSMDRTGPSSIFLERCVSFQKNPPKDDWDGVNNLSEK